MNITANLPPLSAQAIELIEYGLLVLSGRDDDSEWNLLDQVGAMRAISRERKALGMSLWDVEERSGVSLNSAYYWLAGNRHPAISNLVALAETVGFEVVMRSKSRREVFYNLVDLRPAMAALDHARRERALTTKKLRALTSVASNSFYAWLKQERTPTLEKFAALVEALGFELIMQRKC
ncbi:helix-turn-helix transcriptional regulator [Rhizobium sp. IBUN]|uniref:helix-turn-helix domain-containing protein n=1 Tax=Rhizobium sp. IBUN TaxID=1042326 RepID=UPI0004703F99|nr:helix-turn-helix transcriptional regulator [Rhizobium sp. IBUN]